LLLEWLFCLDTPRELLGGPIGPVGVISGVLPRRHAGVGLALGGCPLTAGGAGGDTGLRRDLIEALVEDPPPALVLVGEYGACSR